jgi:hypothetical protein
MKQVGKKETPSLVLAIASEDFDKTLLRLKKNKALD